ALLYQMLLGRVVFEADGVADLLLGHMTRTPERPRDIDPAISAHVERAVLTALERDPAKRFQTVDQLLVALETPATIAAHTPVEEPMVQFTAPPEVAAWALEREFDTTDASDAAFDAAFDSTFGNATAAEDTDTVEDVVDELPQAAEPDDTIEVPRLDAAELTTEPASDSDSEPENTIAPAMFRAIPPEDVAHTLPN